ncbi:hypothetical protein SELMODRAFT_410588 [Selaginella moellendorffii]|uniref:Uncharacterized protein n=1 Tax=Selaginella moellendorffii TaxID=88036 RepID=D8RF78_SELML|nr:hypothetical protein SELMODRAFT_410588 [Selaginella moellendorffii]
MAEIKRAREATEFQGESGDQQGGGGFVPPDLFKRASVVHVSSEVQEATSQWKLGVPPAPEISNSSTAGSEISEREREQLLHARQLVLQQGLPWVTGQNHKLQRSSSDCFSSGSRIPSSAQPPPNLAATFQLSQSWNMSSTHVVQPEQPKPAAPPDDDAMHRASYCADMPYIVHHAAGSGGGTAGFPGDDMLVIPPAAADILDCGGAADAASGGVAAAFDRQQSLDSVKSEEQQQQHEEQDHQQQQDHHFPSLQLGPCSSEMISASPLNQLEMAVDFEPHHQLLSLGGYSAAANAFAAAEEETYRVNGGGGDGDDGCGGGGGGGGAMAEIMAGPLASQCDGLSWIFSSSSNSQKSSNVTTAADQVAEVVVAAEEVGGGGRGSQDPSCFLDGFGLALGHDPGDGDDHRGVVETSDTHKS